MRRIILDNVTYILAILIASTLIVWSYVEEGFYTNYVEGEPYLFWTVYIFPWVIIFANVLHYFISRYKRKKRKK